MYFTLHYILHTCRHIHTHKYIYIYIFQSTDFRPVITFSLKRIPLKVYTLVFALYTDYDKQVFTLICVYFMKPQVNGWYFFNKSYSFNTRLNIYTIHVSCVTNSI